jgi:hypothetical protein
MPSNVLLLTFPLIAVFSLASNMVAELWNQPFPLNVRL